MASVNTEPVRIGLARLVDCEHGSRMDLFALAPTTHLVTQVGYNIMPVMYMRMSSTSPLMCVQIMMREKPTLFFSFFSAG
jgi:hypothetical protein